MKAIVSLVALLLTTAVSQAQLSVTVSPVKITGQKAIVPLAVKNNFSEKIESARAAVFLLDDRGKMVGQSSKWVIGSGSEYPSLSKGTTNTFHFVITAQKPLPTNLTAKVTFTRVVLENGKVADAMKDVTVVASP